MTEQEYERLIDQQLADKETEMKEAEKKFREAEAAYRMILQQKYDYRAFIRGMKK